jgi:hypothetical protein
LKRHLGLAVSIINKLSKENQKRHFPEKSGGKGDIRYRGRRGAATYNSEDEAYRNNKFWDSSTLNRKKKCKEEEKRMMREEKARLSKEICGK